MSLATRCPACGTIFRVVQDQLKVSEGWVRCGQCHEVFHGIEALFDLDSDPAVAARRAAARGPAAPPPTRVFADQRASAPIPMPTQAPAAPRPAAPPSPIAIPARPATAAPTPPSRFGETGPPSQAPAPVARPGYTGFTPATRPLPPAPERPAPFVAPRAPLPAPPAPQPPPSPPAAAPTPATFSPVATRGTIAPRFAARLAEEAARAQAATAAPTPAMFTSTPIAPPPAPRVPSADAFGAPATPQPDASSWQSPPAPVAPVQALAPTPAPDPEPTEFVVVEESPAPVPVAAEPAPAPRAVAPVESQPPALPAFAPTPLPPPPAPAAPDLPPPPSFLMAKPTPVAAPAPTPVPEAPAMYIPPSLLARPPVMAPPPAPEPVAEPVPASPAAADLPEPPRAAAPIIVREPTPDLGGSTLPSMLADDAADEGRAGPPTLASMLPEDAGEWPPKRGKNKPGDPNATESQLVDKTKDPRFLREAKSGARWRKPWVRAVLSVMALALVATALGQVAWPQRDTLAARWPATLPAWQWLCEQAGCSIEPPRALASLTLEGATLNATDTEHVLLFAADLHNHSSHEVRVPSFDVTFLDLNGEIVSRKVLTPEDLGIHQVALAGDVELHVHARLQMGTQAASGFQAEMFYP